MKGGRTSSSIVSSDDLPYFLGPLAVMSFSTNADSFATSIWAD